MAERSQKRKVAHGLVALSSAAILTVYAAGYVRTRAAAERLHLQAARRWRAPAPPAAPPAAADAGTPAASPSPPAAAAPPPGASSGAATPRPAPEPSSRSASPSPSASPAPAAPTPSPEPPPALSPEPASPASEPAGSELLAPAIPAEAAADVPAPESESAPAAADADEIAYRDGTYLGWGRCRHGRIQAEVTVENGRIAAARVASCQTRWACSLVDDLVPEVALHQGPPVSFISGASQSSDAFYYAVVDALSQAR